MSQKVTYYDINGREVIESHMCVAKKIEIGQDIMYFIKHFEYGPQAGFPVNPYGVTFDKSLLDKMDYSGDYITKYIEATETRFDSYLKFLNTKNDLLYRRTLDF